MTRRGFVPYGPAGAAVEALARVMAADLKGTSVTANVLLPGGATATGMIPDDVPLETRATLLDPAIMGPPIVWLASAEAEGIHDERIVAKDFDKWLAQPLKRPRPRAITDTHASSSAVLPRNAITLTCASGGSIARKAGRAGLWSLPRSPTR